MILPAGHDGEAEPRVMSCKTYNIRGSNVRSKVRAQFYIRRSKALGPC